MKVQFVDSKLSDTIVMEGDRGVALKDVASASRPASNRVDCIECGRQVDPERFKRSDEGYVCGHCSAN